MKMDVILKADGLSGSKERLDFFKVVHIQLASTLTSTSELRFGFGLMTFKPHFRLILGNGLILALIVKMEKEIDILVLRDGPMRLF